MREIVVGNWNFYTCEICKLEACHERFPLGSDFEESDPKRRDFCRTCTLLIMNGKLIFNYDEDRYVKGE